MRACEHDIILRDGPAALMRFRGGAQPGSGTPLLLVPSLINRWYVLDLHDQGSVAKALVDAGMDTYCLDWGISGDEDRYFGWDDVLARLARMRRAVRQFCGVDEIGLLGYCVGGTLSAIHTALQPEGVSALVNLAGPIDFSKGGMLRELVDPRWFDAAAVSCAGNISPMQMQSGFVSLRPTNEVSKWILFADKMFDPAGRKRFEALQEWAGDNVPFPAAAYQRYISELYQDNQLAKGTHYIGAQRIDLSQVRCPTMTIVAEQDSICPAAAATALGELTQASEHTVIRIPGGHVGAVVGSRAKRQLYPQLVDWLSRKLGISAGAKAAAKQSAAAGAASAAASA